MYVKKIFPLVLHHRQHPELLIQSRMDKYFHVVEIKFWFHLPNTAVETTDKVLLIFYGSIFNEF